MFASCLLSMLNPLPGWKNEAGKRMEPIQAPGKIAGQKQQALHGQNGKTAKEVPNIAAGRHPRPQGQDDSA